MVIKTSDNTMAGYAAWMPQFQVPSPQPTAHSPRQENNRNEHCQTAAKALHSCVPNYKRFSHVVRACASRNMQCADTLISIILCASEVH